MAESKYGRLFTEADVKCLLRYAAHRGDVDGIVKLGQVDGINVDPGARLLAEYEAGATGDGPFEGRMGLAFPADEPLFLLRGQDEWATVAIEAYERTADLAVTTTDLAVTTHPRVAFRQSVRAALRAFDEWQRRNPDRTKVPD